MGITNTKRISCFLLCALLGLSSSGCAVLTHYTSRVGPARNAYIANDTERALTILDQQRLNVGSDRLCYLFEEGTLKHSASDFEGSRHVFFEAERMIDERDMRAIISLGKTAEQFGPLLLNEKTTTYEGEGYERVFLHTLQALNFVLDGDKEGARVEIRKAYQSAETIAELNEKKLAKIEEQLEYQNSQRPSTEHLNKDSIFGSINQTLSCDRDFCGLERKAIGIKNAYQNAFTYYLSSVVYEMNGDHNDAFIDCRTANELRSSVSATQKDLVRLAAKNGFRDDEEFYRERFDIDEENEPNDSGWLVVVFQCGVAIEKKQVWIPIPFPHAGMQSVAFPIYKPVPFSARGLSLYDGEKKLQSTDIVADMDGLAMRNLKDRIPEMVLRTAIRFAVKTYATYQLRKEMGSAGTLLGSALTAITEQADLRSWLLMPSNIQVARIPLKKGSRDIRFVLEGRGGQTLDTRNVSVDIEENKITLVNIRGVEDFVNEVQVAPPL